MNPFHLKLFLLLIIVFKLIIASLFSSDFQEKLFKPFMFHFVENWDNPWAYFYKNKILDSNLPSPFPYPPLMMYILTPFYFIASYFKDSLVFTNLIIKIPTLIFDLVLLKFLWDQNVKLKNWTTILYFSSPIIMYASYMHSQFDLIPTCILFCSLIYLFKEKLLISALIFGLAISTKFHVIAVLPLVLIYIFKNYNVRYTLYYSFLTGLVYAGFSFPFIFSEGYRHYVLGNEQQDKIFDSFLQVGNLKFYFIIFALFVLFSRFFVYKKINKDLLISFIGITFSVFLFFIIPSPGWFVWLLPFLVIFLVKNNEFKEKLYLFYGLFSFYYLFYFIFIYSSGLIDLKFLHLDINTRFTLSQIDHFGYTIFNSLIFVLIISLYRFGIKSNSIYQRESAIVIGISGDSSVGKSTLLSSIKQLLPPETVVEIEGDGDHKWERGDKNWEKFTHLDPKANFLYRQAEHIHLLKMGKKIQRVDYEHGTGKFTRPLKITSKDFIVLSGLHSFYLPLSRKIIDLKIYIDPEEKLRRHWKILRDSKKRNYKKEDVLSQIEQRLDDSKKYIHPQKEFADLVVSYFTKETFEVGDEKFNPTIQMKLSIDIDLNLEEIIQIIESYGITIFHDYEENLKFQTLILEKPLPKIVVEKLYSTIPNLDELIVSRNIEERDYISFIQFIISLYIAKLKKI